MTRAADPQARPDQRRRGPLGLYSDSLRRQTQGGEDDVIVRFRDGRSRPLLVSRWIARADEIEERALRALHGPVLDVGCGPGRHLHALARRGVFGLGVDLSPVAVGLARGAGANAIVGSIFDELPGTDSWASALLLDGNIGIGGDPARLLRRVGGLLAADGQMLVELEPPETTSVRTHVRLETVETSSEWFAWAEVSAADITGVAANSGFAVRRWWTEGGRWFALLASG
ncbi:MAG: class I SAM-dependent methyltransferase [Solirubrobacteraceae bacterium]